MHIFVAHCRKFCKLFRICDILTVCGGLRVQLGVARMLLFVCKTHQADNHRSTASLGVGACQGFATNSCFVWFVIVHCVIRFV